MEGGASLFYLEEFLIATYSKPSNESLLFYSMTRRPTWVDFVITTISEMNQEHRIFLYFLILSMLPFQFLPVASRVASHFCLFYKKGEASHYTSWARIGSRGHSDIEERLGRWMSAKEDHRHDWFRPAVIHLLQPAVHYHKQKCGSIRKKGGELLPWQSWWPVDVDFSWCGTEIRWAPSFFVHVPAALNAFLSFPLSSELTSLSMHR